MAEKSNIQWTDATFNPWIGCHKVSPECKFCYAEADMDNRRKRVKWGIHGSRSVTSYMYWKQALSWDRAAKSEGKMRKVFCASLADIFEEWAGQVIDSKQKPLFFNGQLGIQLTEFGGEKSCDVDGVPAFNHYTADYIATHYSEMNEWEPLTIGIIRQFLFRLQLMTPDLDWLCLTKRIENARMMLPQYPIPNLWLGTSVGHSDSVHQVDELRKCKDLAKFVFLSCEPLLEPLEIDLTGIDWVIIGGESGGSARECKIEWIESLVEKCRQAGAAVFVKQLGAHLSKQFKMSDNHGGNIDEFPKHLQIREFPKVVTETA